MRKSTLIPVIGIVCAFWSCNGPTTTQVTENDSALIAGKVFPAGINATAEAVQGSTVKSVQCDANGNYQIDNLVTGSCMLVISAKHYGTSRNPISLVGGENEVKDITMGLLPFPITAVSPTIQTTNVSTGSYISIYFSLPMDSSSVKAAFSTVPATTGTFVWYSNYTQLQFMPNVYLLPSTTYAVTVDSTAKSLDNYHLEFPLSYSFTTTLFQVNSSSPQSSSSNFSTQQSVYISFNEPIIDSTIVKAITVQPATFLNFSWYSNECVITPSSGTWQNNAKYTIAIDTSAKDIWGQSLQQADTIVFYTTPFLVSNTNPQNQTGNFPPTQAISFNFNASINDTSLEKAVTVSPSAVLSFAWSSNGCTIMPIAGAWKSNTKYTVTIDTTARDLWGNSLQQSYTIVFSTAPFQVGYANYQAAGSYISTSMPVDVQFNSPPNDSSILRAISIQPATDLSYSWYGNSFSFSPVGGFWRSNTNYAVTINTSAQDLWGNNLQQSYVFGFVSAPISVNNASPAPGQINVDGSTTMTIVFSTPMDSLRTEKAIKITKIQDTTGIPIVFTSSSLYFGLSFAPASPLDPLTEYKISVDTTAADIYGVTMPTAWSSTFTTR